MAKEAPKPGIYTDLPDPEYREMQALSHSDLRQWISGHKATGRALVLGTAFHERMLQPHIARGKYTVTEEEHDLRTAEGKAAMLKAELDTKKIALRPSEAQMLKMMRQSVVEHPLGKAIVDSSGDVEVSAVAELDGVLCKCRIDKIHPGKKGPVLVDLKTTGCE